MKLLFKLADNMFFLIGSIITLLIAIIGGIIAFHSYPITTTFILSLWLLALLFAIISDKPQKAA
ncbi:TPA: hypothetical protein RNX13_002361 [Pasteurella multocida]|nr:hypothetical protein [Pasteurella multocida]HDX1018344.1 hypothetical protein [Pasteurella multocida]